MAPRTRSATSSPMKRKAVPPSNVEEHQHDPVKVLVVPQRISPDARILLLPHPTDGATKHFLFCPNLGLFDLKKTSTPSVNPRTMMFAPLNHGNDEKLPMTLGGSALFSSGYINKSAEMLTATPYDLAFVLLRFVAPPQVVTKKALFQPLEDILDSPEREDKSLLYILRAANNLVSEAMSRICDTIEAGDGKMFRYNEEKVFNMVLQKAQNVAEVGLPASLEDRFVTRILEAPMLSVKREDSAISVNTSQSTKIDVTSQADSFDSESTTASSGVSTIVSEVSIASTVLTIPEDNIPLEMKQLQRIKTAYNFITATCVPQYITQRLAPLLTESKSVVDFEPLEEYLKQLAILRAEAAASRSLSDFSRKRGLEDDEAAEEKAEKKRKQQEEDKRKKANESRGVRDLKKVNVSGMKTMSHFFTKAPATTKAKT